MRYRVMQDHIIDEEAQLVAAGPDKGWAIRHAASLDSGDPNVNLSVVDSCTNKTVWESGDPIDHINP